MGIATVVSVAAIGVPPMAPTRGAGEPSVRYACVRTGRRDAPDPRMNWLCGYAGLCL